MGEAEPLMRRALNISEASYGADLPSTLSTLFNLAVLLFRLNRRSEAGELLRKGYNVSEKAADQLRYYLCCFECLEGNLEEAKRLIAEHLGLHSEMRDQALKNPDLACIRDFIETI